MPPFHLIIPYSDAMMSRFILMLLIIPVFKYCHSWLIERRSKSPEVGQ